MRLTLRTLLAYMDEILEPGDREELAKKIETSDFANDLLLRTKDTMRRLRLSAPQVVGTGMALDPNTVAEYLDNVLPPDAVADFERICLESDVHLAEVASAHHVLTMVLGEPAEVDPVARQRMYGIPAEAERRKQVPTEAPQPIVHPELAAVAAAPPRVAPATSTFARARLRESEIPDYLRASAWSGSRLALGALAAVLLVAVGAMFVFGLRGWQSKPVAMNTTNGTTPSASLSANAGDVADAPPITPPVEPPIEPSPNGGQSAVESGLVAAPPRLALPAMSGASPTVATEPVVEETPVPSEEITGYEVPAATEPDSIAVADYTDSDPTVALAPPIPPRPGDEFAPLPPVDGVPPSDTPVSEATADDTLRVASSNVATGGVADATASAEPIATAVDEEPAERSPELGSYLEGRNILLRYDPTAQAWFRMQPRTTLLVGDRLLALPAFYPKLTLVSGFYMKLSGGTLVSLIHEDASDVPEIDVAFGRVVIVNTTNGENRLRLRLGSTSVEVGVMPNSTFALEVAPGYVPGNDPREAPSSMTIHVYARDGSIVWQDGGVSETVAAPSEWTIANGMATARTAEPNFPDWIDHEPVEQRSEQLYGVPAIEAALDPSRPAEAQLLELYQKSKRREVKSLAARSGVFVGQFVPFVEALRDSDQKSTWKTHIETLRSAMSLGPDSAERIWETLVEQRGEQPANDLYEMLCGYSREQVGETPEEVQSGAIAKLIDWLEKDSLDYRVLASQDLWEITGMRLMPNPAGSPTERARGVRIWRERLRSGEVMPLAQGHQ